MSDAKSILPPRLLALYALPALPLAALTLPLYIVVPTFYTETIGLPLASVGLALLAVRIFDAVNDPVAGWLADRWRPVHGRRRTFFALSLPVTGIAALMLFMPPAGAGVAWLAGWAALLSAGFSASLLSYTAWGAELAGGYRERARVAGWREAATLVGTLVAIAVPFAIGIGSAQGLHGLAVLGFAVLAGLLVFGGLAVWKLPEPKEYSRSRVSLRDGLAAMGSNRPFLRLITAFLINGFANGIPATLFLYFVSERLGAPDMRGPLLFLYFLCGVAGVPAAVKLAGRYGKHRTWACGMIAACLVFATVPLLGEGDIAAFAVICAITGFLVGFDLALPSAIQADVIDVDTAASGEQRSGVYFAAWSLATKLSLALAVGILFPLLSLFGFEAGTDNPESALTALAVLYALVPVGFKAVAVALMWNFPLDETAHAQLREQIEAAR